MPHSIKGRRVFIIARMYETTFVLNQVQNLDLTIYTGKFFTAEKQKCTIQQSLKCVF